MRLFPRPLADLILAAATDAPTSTPAPLPGPTAVARGGRLRSITAGRFYVSLIVLALAVGALSLLFPSTPSYDPWAWIVWGREIVHLDLQTTGGPTWKPLPMIFTTLFAPFGQAEPNLWLLIARAGAFAAMVMAARLAYRLVRLIGVRSGGADAAPVAPAVLAAAIAFIALTFGGAYISDNALGYSEGLATAIILIAVDRHLDGSPRQAFTIGFLAALDRPELWLFWGPYGLWLFSRDAGARKLVVGLFLLIPVLWFLPEYWGSGHLLRGATRATHARSNSPAFAKCPFCVELTDHAWPTMLLRIKVAALLAAGTIAFVLARLLRLRRTALSEPRRHGQLVTLAMAVLGLAWFVVIAVMTQAGFSGNNRYLVIGSALVDIAGAVAWGWAVAELIALVRARRHGAAVGPTLTWIAAAAVLVLFIAMPPNLIGPNHYKLARTHGSLNYQAKLRAGAEQAIARYGGAAKMLRCGTVMTEGFQVPMVAWYLGVHTLQVTAPAATGPESVVPPNVVLQTRSQRGHALLPILHGWPQVHYTYDGTSGPFRVFTHCRA